MKRDIQQNRGTSKVVNGVEMPTNENIEDADIN